jgi:hypothetical protein
MPQVKVKPVWCVFKFKFIKLKQKKLKAGKKMNTSKLFICTIAFLFFIVFALNSFGQSKNNKDYRDCTPEEKAAIIADNLKPVLNLSDAQYNKIYIVYLDRIRWKSVNEVAGIVDNKSIRRKKFEEFKANLRNVLTEEQLESMKSYCESIKERK